ncbi:SpoIIE family protein phosphatase [Modestobacter sp. Leaf380]|uniref:SpoIIE family protein phosphatase n=1 Tax=Modestobacter sp. Leaf380 TaxID=1736356 RepID=UPI0006F34E36|nr:SpoIIE family protein phosphatase [Modestobacter sp. Leaf380]KQS66685.1 hypothetical protein ASG41_09545 [Modestobacter sp. Leaf380]
MDGCRDQVVERMPVGWLALDADWVVRGVNAAGLRVIGKTREELLGADYWESFPDNRHNAFGESYRRVRETGVAESLEAWYPEPLNTWFEVTAVPAGDGLDLFFAEVSERRRAQERLAVLALVSAELAGNPDPVDSMARIPRLVVPAIADWAVVTVIDDDGRPADVGSWHADARLREVLSRYVELRLSALPVTAPLIQALTTEAPVHVTGQQVAETLAPGEARDLQRQLADGTGVYLPLLGRGRTLGLLTLWCQSGRALAGDELAAAREVADRIGLALDNGRLYRQQAQLAEELQRSLLTQPFQPDHAEVAVRYTPAVEAARVGGDWYDAFLQPSGTMMLVIGDVVGHDTAAAAMMGQLRSLLRGIAAYSDAGPAEVLRGLDAAMSLLDLQTLATAAVARLEQTPEDVAADRTVLRWANAGHLDPMVLRPDGSITEPASWQGDLLLGVDSTALRREQELVLVRGSTVLLFTDGLIERRGEDLDTGLARMRAVVAELADEPLTVLCDELVERLVHGRPDDDVALVAVRLHPQDRPRPPEAGPRRVPDEVPGDPAGP